MHDEMTKTVGLALSPRPRPRPTVFVIFVSIPNMSRHVWDADT